MDKAAQYTPMLDSGVGIDLPNGETVFIHNDSYLRELIVRAVNAHDALVGALEIANKALWQEDYSVTHPVAVAISTALLLAKHGAASTNEEAA